jgi:hypothetical protein
MKNYDSSRNQGISWNEFKVVARNSPHAVRFENRILRNKMNDSQVQTGHKTMECFLDLAQVLDYTYSEDNLTQMDEFRVQRHNERFGFSVENPSDEVFKQHASH